MYRTIFIILFLLLSTALVWQKGFAQESRSTTVEEAAAQSGPKLSPQEIRDRILEAERLFKEGKMEAAIYSMQQVYLSEPGNDEVLLKLGAMAIQSKNWAYSIETLRNASRLRPQDIQLRLILMDIYKAYQMPIQEITAGKEILAIKSDHVQALRRLGELYQDQHIPDDEAEVRTKLMEVEPRDYKNLSRLANLLEKNGEIWEATLVMRHIIEQFPEKVEDRKHLAHLYAIDEDYYSEFWELEKILKAGGRKYIGLRQERSRIHRAMLRKHKSYPAILGEGKWDRSSTDTEITDTVSFKLGRQWIFLKNYSGLTVNAGYMNQNYRPTNQFITGFVNVNSLSLDGEYFTRWDEKRQSLIFRPRFTDVSVTGGVAPTDPTASEVNYPFLEPRSFGGTILTGQVDYELLLGKMRQFKFTPYFHRDVVEDIDAYVRLIYKDSFGVLASYTWPDTSSVSLAWEEGWISDNNRRSYAGFALSYPIYMSYPLVDRDGHRFGSSDKPMPRLQLNFTYSAESIKHDHASSYYGTDDGMVYHTFQLQGRKKVGEISRGDPIFIIAEGIYSFGHIKQDTLGFRIGASCFNYYGDSAELTYGYSRTPILPGSQLNANLTGVVLDNQVELKVIWHFDTRPEPSPAGKERKHKSRR
jgi:tetratricopeptide (TPR) repeat protein